jgi:pimeloyl-ACP methyl ester carboxylesterase
MYRLTMDPAVFATLRDYTEFKPASAYRGKGGFDHRITREGIGVPMVAINRGNFLPGIMVPGKEDDFKRREGYTSPRTLILIFGKPAAPGQPRDVRVTIVDPRKVPIETVGKRVLPVAADFTAPLIAAYPGFGSRFTALVDAIYPDSLLPKSDIYALEVYDPGRIPVLLVHGLFSTPDMWKNLINELNATPGIGGRYQFYTFTYPTGLAPSYTARILREKLARATARRPLDNGYVLIGHSMGGLLSRMQITDSGRVLWDTSFGAKAEAAYRSSSPADPMRKDLCFSADPHARRAIFICVPHRGSPMADKSLVQWLGRLAKAPLDITETLATSPLRVLGVLPDRLPGSAQGLSPKSPVLLGLDRLPMKAPVHSIIGDRGKPGLLAASSDGIVPYWSSHLDAAASEKIIPTGHGGFDHPLAIGEIGRILGEHARKARATGKK